MGSGAGTLLVEDPAVATMDGSPYFVIERSSSAASNIFLDSDYDPVECSDDGSEDDLLDEEEDEVSTCWHPHQGQSQQPHESAWGRSTALTVRDKTILCLLFRFVKISTKKTLDTCISPLLAGGKML